MKILAIERELPGATPEKFQPLLTDEARRVWELQQAGPLREIYMTDEGRRAVMILECAEAEEARQILVSLPLVKAGLIEFDLYPLMPYAGFARLFV
jgi:hypothetical protein